MKYAVQIYCEANGVPAPLEPQAVNASTPQAAAEKLAGGRLLEEGHHGKLAAIVLHNGQKIPFYRP